MKDIRAEPSAVGRHWVGMAPATDAQIDELKKAAKVALPPSYLELLRENNGGEGDLALAPLWFQLFDVTTAIEMANAEFYRKEFKGLFFFGSNGGLESIAFDTRGSVPWPVVMVDCIAGIESASQIASDIDEFIQAIGLSAPDIDK